MSLFNITSALHSSIKHESVVEDYLFCMAWGLAYYPIVDLSLMNLAQHLVNETGVGYHMLDLSGMSFEFYSYGTSLSEEELAQLNRDHINDMELEHEQWLEFLGVEF